MTENLKRCPFCGGKAKCIEYYGLYHVVCCDCYTTGRDCQSIETACKAWNSRPIEDELEAENARLREALVKIIGETKEDNTDIKNSSSPSKPENTNNHEQNSQSKRTNTHTID